MAAICFVTWLCDDHDGAVSTGKCGLLVKDCAVCGKNVVDMRRCYGADACMMLCCVGVGGCGNV
ncbi:Hypothetical protein CpCap5W_2127 [Corynebacterium pseudotuberculosis]|nr:Hypothetical protein Cp3995_0595 [Corynebacterium pseudotuberculosis 3/99-5]AZN19477.1 hypothetical protein CpCap1W_0615 [Corynebacterium pseudotuberculosis]AEX39440.1 Hypothetical protein Cp3995_0976 [Corynebacterium pseudotuberculosis 3/99-5]AEX40195.1 Hypothetical protein Cp3995_1742 [Corynebacterium pseudotuberculosis 3/99-5]AZN19801.1 hypothetical protein CpCap1W_0959 [Corynebacterium pseudotuberculosis]